MAVLGVYLVTSARALDGSDHSSDGCCRLDSISAVKQVLAERLRPKSQPLHEILHRQASVIQNRHYQQAQEQEEAALRV